MKATIKQLIKQPRNGSLTINQPSNCVAEKGDAYITLTDDQVIAKALEITARRLLKTGSVLANPSAVRDYLRVKIAGLENEVFGMLLLNNRNRIIASLDLFTGTIDGATVHMREIVKAALKDNAAAVILYHNHPSGSADPSQADELITRRIKDALAVVDIRVLDHIIVTPTEVASFSERGLI